ncbi:MAG: hypothetical protein ABJI69_00310 [Balneola sp.]
MSEVLAKSTNNVITYLIGAAVVGLFVFVLNINANQAGQAEFNKNQTAFNETVLKQFQDISSSIEALSEKLNSGTADRYTRREADLNDEITIERQAKNNALLKIWVLEKIEAEHEQD